MIMQKPERDKFEIPGLHLSNLIPKSLDLSIMGLNFNGFSHRRGFDCWGKFKVCSLVPMLLWGMHNQVCGCMHCIYVFLKYKFDNLWDLPHFSSPLTVTSIVEAHGAIFIVLVAFRHTNSF